MFLSKKSVTKNQVYFRLIILWVVILTILYSCLSLLHFRHFQSGAYDLGIYDQAVWLYSRFLYPFSSIENLPLLADHLTLTLPVLSPLFWLWDDVRILLVFQSFWVALSVIPVYLITVKRTENRLWGIVISISYSLFYGYQYAVQFDFHPLVIGVGFLVWTAYFLEIRNHKMTAIFALLAVLSQENMGLMLTGLGILYVFRRGYRRQSVILIFSGVILSVAAVMMMRAVSPVGYRYMPQLPQSVFKYIGSLFDDQQKQLSWLLSFGWFGFLPLLSPGAVVAVIWDLSLNFSTGPGMTRAWSPYMHYRASLAPVLTLGLIDAAVLFRSNKLKSAVFTTVLIISMCFFEFYFHLPLNKLSKPDYWKEVKWESDNRALVLSIPPEDPLAAQQNLVPFVSHRQQIYLAWPKEMRIPDCPGRTDTCWWFEFPGHPDYLLIDTRAGQWLTQTLADSRNFTMAWQNMEKAGRIILEKSVGDARLYKINY